MPSQAKQSWLRVGVFCGVSLVRVRVRLLCVLMALSAACAAPVSGEARDLFGMATVISADTIGLLP